MVAIKADSKPYILIIANTLSEASAWAKDNAVSPRDCAVVNSERDLRGINFRSGSGVRLIWTGRYWERRDFSALLSEVEFLGGPLPPYGPDRAAAEDAKMRVLKAHIGDPVLSPEAIEALFGEENVKKPMRTMRARPEVDYEGIATAIAETILDPDERTALIDRLIPVLKADPTFAPPYFRDLAGG